MLFRSNGDTSLSLSARNAIESPENFVFISVGSLLEIAIKVSLKKLDLGMPFSELSEHIVNNGFEILPISFEHTLQLSLLPFFHRDPFDRILIAQARSEKISIIGKDDLFTEYDVKLVW